MIYIDAPCWLDCSQQATFSEQCFFEATIKSIGKDSNAVYNSHTERTEEHKHVVLHQREVNNQDGEGFPDMVNMEVLNDAELLQNLKLRFTQDLIFTQVGPTLLVLNPFKTIQPLFHSDLKHTYMQGRGLSALPPHIYQVSCMAYKCLFENDKNQSIVISGESGAGKTENAKFCMNLLTCIGGESAEEGIETKILACNPILEAFGNAKTVRNNNSSRFGKYVKIIVEKQIKTIRGAQITNYLLEKSRVNSQGKNERNFHIFYHLLRAPLNQLEKLYLVCDGEALQADRFEYLRKSGCFEAQGINDEEGFQAVANSLQVLGLSSHYDAIFKIVAAVLMLGNLQFDSSSYGNGIDTKFMHFFSDSTCGITPTSPLSELALLMCLPEQQVKVALTMKQRQVGKQIINSPLSESECLLSRDSLAKEIYIRLFNFLVRQLNQTIAPKHDANTDASSVGLLDIYGFEVFDVNGFEQMLINYTNEKLHQLYIHYVFKEEERTFHEEGLTQYIMQLNFTDNQSIIDSMERPPQGIFLQLDESCSIASTDDQFLNKLITTHKTNPCIQLSKVVYNYHYISSQSQGTKSFVIIHTAKPVQYCVEGFREKNKDDTSALVTKILMTSQLSLLSQLFTDQDPTKDKFIGQKIRKSMTELMKELNSCDVHFVRCLKPNEEKQANKFNESLVINQIRYLGVLDSLRVRRDSYPIRRQYRLFYRAFSLMTNNKPFVLLDQDVTTNYRQIVQEMVDRSFHALGPSQLLMGSTKIFLRQQALQKIQAIYDEAIKHKTMQATKIQRAYRCHKLRGSVAKFHSALRWIKCKILRVKLKQNLRRLFKRIACLKRILKRVFQRRRNLKHEDQIMVDLQAIYQQILQIYLKRARMVLHANMMIANVSKIQRFFRRYTLQVQERELKQIKSLAQYILTKAWDHIRSLRAIIIQSHQRGYACRKRNRKLINKLNAMRLQNKQFHASRRIQRTFKMFVARKHFNRCRRLIMLVQSKMKSRWIRRTFLKIKEKAVIIQKYYRPHYQKVHGLRLAYQFYIEPMLECVNHSNQTEKLGIRIIQQESLRYRNKVTVKDKLSLVHIPISIVVNMDISDDYQDTWYKSYLESLDQYSIQYCALSEVSSLIVSSNCRLFQWGVQQFKYQCTIVPKKVIGLEDKFIILDHKGDLYLTADGELSNILRGKKFFDICSHKNHQEQFFLDQDGGLQKFHNNKLTEIPIINSQFSQVRFKQVSTGLNFLVALSTNGLIYSVGCNQMGQLGLRDYEDRIMLCQVACPIYASELSCGFGHTMVRASNFSLYTWGQTSAEPNKIQLDNLKPLQICCTSLSSYFIASNQQIYKVESQSVTWQIFEIPKNCYPIRLQSQQRKCIDLLFLTVAMSNSKSSATKVFMDKVLNRLTLEWGEKAKEQIFAPFDDQFANIFDMSNKSSVQSSPQKSLRSNQPLQQRLDM